MGNCLKPQRAATWADGDEWEEEAEVCSSKAAAAAVEEKNLDGGIEEESNAGQR